MLTVLISGTSRENWSENVPSFRLSGHHCTVFHLEFRAVCLMHFHSGSFHYAEAGRALSVASFALNDIIYFTQTEQVLQSGPVPALGFCLSALLDYYLPDSVLPGDDLYRQI